MTAITFISAYRQLRPSERAFVDAYVSDAEVEANRRNERVSLILHRAIPDDVVSQSRGMLEKPMVLAAITERISQIAADNELTPQRVIKEYMAMAFSNIKDYIEFDEFGNETVNLSKCTPEQLSAVQSYEVDEGMRGRKVRFKLHPKQHGLDKLAEYIGLLERDNAYWRSENARPVEQAALPAHSTVHDAGEAYSRMINGAG